MKIVVAHKLKLLSLIPLILASEFSFSQDLYFVLDLKHNQEAQVARVKTIIEIDTFYLSKGYSILKQISKFDNSGMRLTKEMYDDDNRITNKVTSQNDTIKRLIEKEIFETSWLTSNKKDTIYNRDTIYYKYDKKGFLISLTEKNKNGEPIKFCELTNDNKGNPIELHSYIENSTSYHKETAAYNYDKNKVAISMFQKDGSSFSFDTIKISYKNASLFYSDGEIYNGNGDLIKWTQKNSNRTVSVFEADYIYDNFGNWTEKKIYHLINRSQGNTEREITTVYTRQFSY